MVALDDDRHWYRYYHLFAEMLRSHLRQVEPTLPPILHRRASDCPGAGARNSIGIMLVSGMIIGTAFTLFVVPSIYMLVAKRHVALVSNRADDVQSTLPQPVDAIA